jgi:hypothetical protein
MDMFHESSTTSSLFSKQIRSLDSEMAEPKMDGNSRIPRAGVLPEMSTKKSIAAMEANGKKRKNCDPKTKTPKKANNTPKEKKERVPKVPKYSKQTKNKRLTPLGYNSLTSGSTSVEPVHLRQNGVGETSVQTNLAAPHNNGHTQQHTHHQQSHLDSSTIILDNLFDNISIDNYEFDDNTSIQSINLIEEKFKTSFDQIQEKLDADLSFDESKLQWQNNLIANDSSNEISDKLLNVEENLMLI